MSRNTPGGLFASEPYSIYNLIEEPPFPLDALAKHQVCEALPPFEIQILKIGSISISLKLKKERGGQRDPLPSKSRFGAPHESATNVRRNALPHIPVVDPWIWIPCRQRNQ